MPDNEHIKINFLGMKFECTNPSPRTVKIVFMLLIFFVVLVVLLPKLSIVKWFSG